MHKKFFIQKNYLTKKDISILIGNSLDHFDTTLYSFLVPILSMVFFTNKDPVVRLILSYSVLATTIFTRPIGGYLFGIIARYYGASIALSYSLIGVGVTTMCIGLIPSYKMIGCFSPFILVILRIIQSIFAEGESSIARLYILEDKTDRISFSASYLYEISTILGIIGASTISTIIINSNHHEYWRLCFIIGGFSGIIGYSFRKYSTVHYKKNFIIKLSSINIFPLKLIWFYKLDILRISIVMGFYYMTYSIPFIVMNNIIPLITSTSLETMMNMNTMLLIVDLGLILLIGRFTKKFNYKKILVISSTILFFTIIPLWAYLNKDTSLLYITIVRLWIIIIGITFTISMNLWLNSIFLNSSKYILITIGHAIGSSIIGRLTPVICLSIYHLTSTSLYIGFYIAFVTLATIWAISTTHLIPNIKNK